MKVYKLHIIFFLALAFWSVNTSLQAQPTSVQPETPVLYPVGYNSGGADPGTTDSDEDNDYVTTGSTTKYYQLPAANVNPSFNYNTNLFANILSSFNWVVNNTSGTAAGAVAAIGAYHSNYKQITWSGIGTANIVATETAHATQGGCTGTAVTTPVRVIAAPTVTFPSSGGTISLCVSGIDGSLTTTLPSPLNIEFTSAVASNRQMNLQYDIDAPGTDHDITNFQVNISETGFTAPNGTGTFTVSQQFNHFGIYTITLKNAGDRIANKGNNYRNSGGITYATYTVSIVPTPNTSPTYHRANNGF